MKNYFKLITLFLFLLNGCAPKVQERQFPQPTMEFGPRNKDTDLGARLKAADLIKPALSWQGVIPTESFFQQAENLVVLGEKSGRENLSVIGLRWIENFYNTPKTSSYTEFSKSPFATLATTQTEEEVKRVLSRAHFELDRSRVLIKNKITLLGQDFGGPAPGANLKEVMDRAEAFTDLVVVQIGGLGLPQIVVEGVRAEIKKQTSSLFADARAAVGQLYTATLFPKAFQLLDDIIIKFEVDLPPEALKHLEQGRLIAKDLERLTDAQAGLTILIDIWNGLSAKERSEYFQAENESLYDFLSKQDAQELSCLRREGCSGGIYNGIAKKLFILPKIKQYGVFPLQVKLNEKILQYFIREIEIFARDFVITLPATFVARIDEGLLEKDGELQAIGADYPGYVKTLLAKWAEKTLPGSKGQIAGFETPVLNIQISNSAKMSLEAGASPLDLKANTVGSSMSAAALFLQKGSRRDDFKMRMALSQINKLIAIGGYRDDAKKLIPALMMPIQKTRTSLDIRNFANSQYSYRIPDRIKMLDSFHAMEEPYEKNFSASAYAEQLKGVSQMLNFTADWKETGFEEDIGKVKAQELVTEIENPALARPLFPKDMFFALNVGDAAVLLKNITKKSTPIFLITLNDQPIWADQYQAGGEETAIMAALVDLKDGQRSTLVKGQDVAKFLLAIAEFMKATDGVERTRSALLLEKDEYGVTPLTALLEGRHELKLLSVALANFISNHLMDGNAVVQPSFSLKTLQRVSSDDFQIEDQALAIQALLAAWEITGMETYLWSAHEIYFAMNKNAFSDKEYFYINGGGSRLSFPQKVNTLRALVELKPSLPPASQTQLARIVEPWMRALEGLQ